MTRRRWIADRWTGSTATLEGEQAQHLSRVLRAQPGMEFDVVAGSHAWLARITSVSRDSVVFELLEELAAAAALPVTLLLSVFKFDRMEWAIEKAVELGCGRILPVMAERTEKHLAQAAGKRVDRWRRIALEAAKQSRRSDLPEIADPLRLPQALAEKPPERRILLSETEEKHPLLRIIQAGSAAPADLALAIGPEGGWTPAEIAAFMAGGWQSASLGPRILRVETAAIAALSIVLAAEDAGDPSPAARALP
ncbi:MAG: Ribosomal small subunit methyltransferase [Acidobacteriaceae bacterium]|nr:Ribosomal small subunit methyltransferase [Acidobacteriaceae bacterium]